jgi:glycosyltransferase involved in cell wall biosynthesis
LRVALDSTYSVDLRPSGIGVYCSNLISALVKVAPTYYFELAYRGNRFARSFRFPMPGANCKRRLLEEFNCYLFRNRVDLFHGLNQRLPRCSFASTVSTFHDLFVLNGDYSTPEFRARFAAFARDAANRSDHIIAVSQYTADRVEEFLEFEMPRIHVVHHGVTPVPHRTPEELEYFRKKNELQAPFLLNVGAIQKRKNIVRIIELLERLPAYYRLVLAGSAGYGIDKIMERIEASPARDRIRLIGYINDDLLAKLYRTAELLIFPSLEEGFGFPVLEAMSAGLPVVTSNCSAMPEIAGGAARLVDPKDTDSIEAGTVEILGNSKARGVLIGKGFKRAAEFHWVKAAHETLQVYETAIKS